MFGTQVFLLFILTGASYGQEKIQEIKSYGRSLAVPRDTFLLFIEDVYNALDRVGPYIPALKPYKTISNYVRAGAKIYDLINWNINGNNDPPEYGPDYSGDPSGEWPDYPGSDSSEEGGNGGSSNWPDVIPKPPPNYYDYYDYRNDIVELPVGVGEKPNHHDYDYGRKSGGGVHWKK